MLGTLEVRDFLLFEVRITGFIFLGISFYRKKVKLLICFFLSTEFLDFLGVTDASISWSYRWFGARLVFTVPIVFACSL